MRPPYANPSAIAKTLKMKTGVRQIREKERNRAMLMGISTPVQMVVRRRKSIAPLRAAASAAMMEMIAPESEVAPLIPPMDDMKRTDSRRYRQPRGNGGDGKAGRGFTVRFVVIRRCIVLVLDLSSCGN